MSDANTNPHIQYSQDAHLLSHNDYKDTGFETDAEKKSDVTNCIIE